MRVTDVLTAPVAVGHAGATHRGCRMKKDSHTIVGELRSMDLNLLVALRALLDERHVSRAAEKAGLSQPGMSRALQRLRTMFQDPLLVKSEQGYELTPRAVAADSALSKVLSDIQYLVAPPSFDPAAAKGDIRIVALDYELVVLLPKIVTRIRNEAPGLNVWTIAPKMNAQEGLDFSPLINGDIHLILTAFRKTHSGLYQQRLLDETNICITAAAHPDAHQSLTSARFMRRDHVWVNIIGPDPGRINQTLAMHGLARSIKVSVPSFLLAAYTAATTEMMAILPYRVILPFLEKSLVATMKMPFDFPSYTVYQYWHERYNKDPQHVWFRKLVLDVARTLC
jgi:DNA-binding transcriptional LysR family regulator